MRRVLISAIIALSVMVFGVVSAAAGAPVAQDGEAFGTPVLADILALITDDDLFATADLTILFSPPPGASPTQHYGGYSSTSPDSGTCGNNWADDTFDRHFTVFTDASSAILVVQQFKRGSFVTPSTTPPNTNESPGACETSPLGSTVNSGITGSMHGYFIIPLPMGTMQTSNSPFCNATLMTNTGCTTTVFIDTHFTPCYAAGTCFVTTFFFHYTAPNQGLIAHSWKNASTDRGGNSGDIRST